MEAYFSDCLIFCRNHADLHIHKLRQRRNLHSFPGRKFSLEIFSIYTVDDTELVHIGNKDGRLYHMTEIKSCFSENRFQVFHHLGGFFLNTAVFQVTGGRVNTYLSRDKQQVSA